MRYRVEVLVKVYDIKRGETEVWQALHPTGGEPYSWGTRREAETMMNMCYPSHKDKARVVEIAQ
jgi:hypothetical protein